jgi:hypothetical protein
MHAKTRQYFKRSLLCARILWLLMPAIIGIWISPVQSNAQTDNVEIQLRARISEFWQAMQDGDYDKAATFIHPDSRKTFAKMPRARVIRWSIQKLEFDESQTSCAAIMTVRRPAPALATEIDWTLNDQWMLSDGQWYFKIPWGENENPMLRMFKERQEVSPRASAAAGPADMPGLKQPAPAKSDLQDLSKALQRLRADPANPRSVQNGEKAQFRYAVVNSGMAPFSVIAADADCHCTVVKKEDTEILPGKTGTIDIVIDTFGLPLGRIDKSVSVQFSDMDQPVTLKLQIDSIPNFKVLPASLDFGSVGKGVEAAASVKVINASHKAVNIISKSNADPNLSFAIDKSALKPGNEANISVRYISNVPGEFLDNLTLETDLAAEPLINVPVKGIIKP